MDEDDILQIVDQFVLMFEPIKILDSLLTNTV